MSKHIPDSLKGARSPFLDSLVIPVFYKTRTQDLAVTSKIKVEDGIVSSVGPVHKHTTGYILEKDRKIEMYFENNGEDLRPFYSAISKEGRLMLEYIMLYCLRENVLLFNVDSKDFMDKYIIKSRTTFWKSKKDLINLGFIAPTSVQNWYWINPKFVFRGYRTKLIETQNNLNYKNE
jgi:hypothetical protein